MSKQVQDCAFVPCDCHAEGTGKLKTVEDHQRKIWALENQLVEVANLVAALEVVSWQLAQVEAPGEMGQLRDAVIGISKSLETRVARMDG